MEEPSIGRGDKCERDGRELLEEICDVDVDGDRLSLFYSIGGAVESGVTENPQVLQVTPEES